MKRFLTLFLFIFLLAGVYAQAPQRMSYQAVVRNANNSLVANQNVSVRITLLQGSATGAAVYTENHTVLTNANGLMTLEVGGGNATNGTFSSINWANGPFFIKSEIDPDGGINYSVTSVQQLLSVPYALYAATSGNGEGPQGPVGPQGPQGEPGPQGPVGPQGPQGPAGQDGAQGPQGIQGPQGVPGQNGVSPAVTTTTTATGTFVVVTDAAGTHQFFVANGADGAAGPQGPQGPAGANGQDGATGPQGPQGPAGQDGATGPQGPQGIQGETGPAGPQGPQGIAGQNGVSPTITTTTTTNGTFVVVTDANGNSQFFVPNGQDGAVGPQGPQGPQGEQGPAGPQGEQGVQGPAGNDGTMTFADLTQEQRESLRGPQGVQGEQGPAGPQGTPGVSPTVAIQALANGNRVIITSATSIDTFTVWNGATGAQGPQGETGADGPQGPQGEQGPAGPQGEQGVQGPAGQDGFSPVVTITTLDTMRTQVTITSAEFPNGQSFIVKNGSAGGSFVQDQANWLETDASSNSYIQNKPTLFSGDYNDLSNKPTIPQVPTNVSAFTNDAGYISLNAIPVNVSSFTNDAGYLTSYTETDPTIYGWAKAVNKPTYNYSEIQNTPNLATVATTGNYNDLSNKPNLATVATTGNYNDLSNKPTIPQVPTNVSAFTNDAGYISLNAIPVNVSSFTNDAGYLTSYTETDPTVYAWAKAANKPTYNYSEIQNTPNLATVATTGNYNDLSDKPNLATVATTGNYNDLSNKPTIPAAANNATLTIQKNGASVGTFTADAAANTSINIMVPTTTSELTNDAGFITSSDIATLNNTIAALNSRIDSLNNVIAEISGQTPVVPGQIAIATNEITNVTVSSATAGGNITNSGGFAITDRGVCWSLNPNPTLSNNYVAASTAGTGEFTVNLTGLSIGNTYYARAYATNRYGTTYGNQVIFATPTLPTVTISTPVALGGTTASCSANVTSSGGATVTTRGICWSTSPNPTVSSVHAASGSGVGSYTINMSGLTPGVTYYLRAYATNMAGTAYSGQQTLMLLASELPEVTTTAVTDVQIKTATLKGQVTYDGGYAVADKGFCYGTSHNPTVSNSTVTNNGDGMGAFTSDLSGLTPGQTYYVRAYATNLAGTAYGAEFSFTMGTHAESCPGVPTLLDVDGNTYHTIKIGEQCWMKENLRTTKFSDGTPISLGNDTSTVTAYRYYPGNSASNVATYGYLYNWKAVMKGASSSIANPSNRQGVCPTGWHVPSHAEWQQLESYVGHEYSTNRTSLKAYARVLASTTGWGVDATLNTTAPGSDQANNNETGFSASPAGSYHLSYTNFNTSAEYWSTSYTGKTYYYRFTIGRTETMAGISGQTPACALAVRCVMDDNSYTPQQRVDAQPCPYLPTIKDVDGNVYNTVQIGSMCWMKENLKTTKYANGTSITLGSSSSSSTKCRYNPNGDTSRVAAYGYLYNGWAVVNGSYYCSSLIPSSVQGVCPFGWHVPSDAEWTQLTDYVKNHSEYHCNGNTTNIAKALAGTTGWSSSTSTCGVGNTPANNNATGFTAVPAGNYSSSGYFGFGGSAGFWSATLYNTSLSYYRSLDYNSADVRSGTSNLNHGYSVRCLRD